MRKIHTTNYKLYNSNIKNDLSMMVISDLHFSYMVDNQKLNYILNFITKVCPEYILIPGDLIDSVDMILDANERKRLISWIIEISKISKIIISLGSHDYSKKHYCKGDKFDWQYYFDNEFFDEIDDIKNVFVLNNKKYEDKDVCVLGYTQSLGCYYPYKNTSKLIPVKECKNIKYEEMQKLIVEKGPFANDKLNLFMSHSPIYLTDKSFENLLKDFDYYISGHMHNGCVPPVLYELWNSTRGLIAPNKELFVSNERNTLRKKGDKLIVNGPLTTFQECSGKMQLFNFMYPCYCTKINFTDDKKFNTNKVYIKQSYIK